MGFQAKSDDDGVVMAVDVCIHAVQTLEDLPNESRELTRKRHTYTLVSDTVQNDIC